MCANLLPLAVCDQLTKPCSLPHTSRIVMQLTICYAIRLDILRIKFPSCGIFQHRVCSFKVIQVDGCMWKTGSSNFVTCILLTNIISKSGVAYVV